MGLAPKYPVPVPITYTFGNHMHWVDMQWLWGYHVLPGSIRDMLHFCRETGSKGNVNFDGVGYEKLAAENPEALADLRAAVQAGTIEVVGASYGQPYGLFHGGESNIRQRIYGVRAAIQLFGVRPVTFWEEEFDFFPQLPQMLRGVGFEYASLFFQWTWHTPELTREDVPIVVWQGQDGSQLIAATRNRLNLHQWPEDVAILMDDLAASPPEEEALILQWLELMPSPDWMCRSEVLLPKTKELLSDPRFEVRFATLGEYLQRATGAPPVVSSAGSAELYPGSEEPETTKKQGAYLPHWTKRGGTYSISFRLADSLPQSVQAELAAEREHLAEMEAGGILQGTAIWEHRRYFSEKVEAELNKGYGSCVLKDPAVAAIVAECLNFGDGTRYHLHAWCVMPNHVHAIVEPLGSEELAQILHTWKSFTAHRINDLLEREGQLWQSEYYDHLIRSDRDYVNQVTYVLQNPAKAGLRDWQWVGVNGQADHGRAGHEDHGRAARGTSVPNGLEARATLSQASNEDHGRAARGTLPVRAYTMDDVWHGMTLGKNADYMRRLSATAETTLLTAESLASTASLFGRPYAQWDVYPTWELEEAWRELLQAQHHDNDECEGLCGHVGQFSYERSLSLSGRVRDKVGELLANRLGSKVTANPCGWARDAEVQNEDGETAVLRNIPSLGLTSQTQPERNPAYWRIEGSLATATRGLFKVAVDLEEGTIVQINSEAGTHLKEPILRCGMTIEGRYEPIRLTLADPSIVVSPTDEPASPLETIYLHANLKGGSFDLSLRVAQHLDALEIKFGGYGIPRPDGGLNAALGLTFGIEGDHEVIADQPYGVSTVHPAGKRPKKYPTGDWMTSPQWFEEVESPFTGLTFVDLAAEDRGLLILHDGSQQWLKTPDGYRNVVSAYDPWDEDFFRDEFEVGYLLVPHGSLDHSTRWKLAQEFRRPVGTFEPTRRQAQSIPSEFSPITVNQPNVAITAFYRETKDSGPSLHEYAANGFKADYPFIVRLVELDGVATEVELDIAGTVAAAAKTNLLGELEKLLETSQSKITLHLRPFEIATVYMDIVEGRKQTRDLDAHREIWATVHRVEGNE